VTLKSGIEVIRGHWEGHHSIELAYCRHSIVSVALCCIISEIKPIYWSKIWIFIPHLHSTGQLWGGASWGYCHSVWYGKTRNIWLADGEKSLIIRNSRFDTIAACDGQTHGHTSCDSIVHAMYRPTIIRIIRVKNECTDFDA